MGRGQEAEGSGLGGGQEAAGVGESHREKGELSAASKLAWMVTTLPDTLLTVRPTHRSSKKKVRDRRASMLYIATSSHASPNPRTPR